MSAGRDQNECCRAAEVRLEEICRYLDGALDPEDVEKVRQHLADCPDCIHEREIELFIRSAVRRCCQEKAPAQLRAAILTRLTQVTVTTTPR
ncbi:mycothiol system anti-sigma-R factor [Micrococcus sp.]|uniref:mycothiol system anti-sigma-R factor n=1 Tax=Micrococcus sp. TaxID=1271 RepID=UPI002A91DAF3|nr:mycothiol system anti-sigma-R factor [Micrococcus sp.]MDY6055071.1 mycothiol system anti-sigma-R factor [Micrococcus sp.]